MIANSIFIGLNIQVPLVTALHSKPPMSDTFDEDSAVEEYAKVIKANDEKHLSLFSELIKSVKIGTDLFRTPAPIFLVEPISVLEKFAHYIAPNSQFWKYWDSDSAETRFLSLIYISMANGSKSNKIGLSGTKPYNPILGEQFHCDINDGETLTEFHAEQISHHPPISGWYLKNEKHGFVYNGWCENSAIFRGNYVTINFAGHQFKIDNTKTGEQYVLCPSETVVDGLLWGTQQVYLYGKTTICSDKYRAVIDYHTKGVVSGEMYCGDEKICSFDGDILKEIYITRGNNRELFFKTPEQIWGTIKLGNSDNFADNHSRKVWKPVTYGICRGDHEFANKEKIKIEEKEREIRKEREKNKEKFVPSLFDWNGQHWMFKSAEHPPLRVKLDLEKKSKWFFF